jgi:hypothetical protein
MPRHDSEVQQVEDEIYFRSSDLLDQRDGTLTTDTTACFAVSFARAETEFFPAPNARG